MYKSLRNFLMKNDGLNCNGLSRFWILQEKISNVILNNTLNDKDYQKILNNHLLPVSEEI